MERRSLLAFTTITIFATFAQASHLQPARSHSLAIQAEGTARPYELVGTRPSPQGLVFARQVLPASAVAPAAQRAQSRVIYLNRDGALLRPGDNDSSRQISSIVTDEVYTSSWDVDDDTWQAAVGCVTDMYARFDVTVTDRDPGNVPHIEALIGGSPGDIGLDDSVAGISPFTTDCGIIESSIIFTFPDLLSDDPQVVCEVVSQEIAHSFGLDHEMLASDPMTYLDYAGDRSFKDRMAECGEYADRDCGINGNVCRDRQNSVQVLTERLGLRGASTAPTGNDDDSDSDTSSGVPPQATGGCSTTSGSTGIAMALAMLGVVRRRRR